MKYIVYCAESPNGKCYVGITSQGLKERKRKHYNKALNGSKTKFHNALRKYKNSFVWKIIYSSENFKDVLVKEQFYIEKLNTFKAGYNLTKGGEGSLGLKVSKKTKNKLSKIFSGKNNPMYGKSGILCPAYGKKQSKQTCLKKSISNGAKRFLVLKKNKFIGEWLSQSECSRDLNLNICNINSCLNNPKRYKSHKGYKFKYADEGELNVKV